MIKIDIMINELRIIIIKERIVKIELILVINELRLAIN